jgi:Lysylphosphatidylglycerol synthase TM region
MRIECAAVRGGAMNDSPQRHLPSHVFNVAVFVIGAAFLVWMMDRLGLANARRVFADAGVWFPLIIGLDVLGLCLDAAAIHAFMKPEARMISYARVLAANASGRAINLLTPGGALGEATKVTMMVTHAPHARVVSAIVLFDLAGFYLSVAIVAVGVPLTLVLVDLPHQLAVVIWVGLALLAPIVIGLAVLVHRGAVGTAIDAVAGLHLVSRARADAWRAKLVDVDRHLRELHTDRSPGTRIGFAWMLASRAVAWCATALVLHAVGVTLTPTLLIGVLSCGILVSWVASAVPLGLGIADGSNYALYDVLGASGAHGVLVTLLGRARMLVIALLGLAAMGVAHTMNRISVARRRRHLLAERARSLAS